MRIVFKFKPTVFSPFYNSKSSPPLRIADVLLLQEHEEERLLLMDGGRGFNCSTPRRFAARLLSGLKRGKVKRNLFGDRKKEDDGVAPPDATDAPDSSSGRCRREANFNVGIGCCLLHLIAESKNELQKITELRIQMEGVLLNVKDELRNTKDLPVSKTLESNDGNESLKCDDVPKEDEMDRLEAELEAELKRLQHHLDTGKLPTDPSQETIEESNINSTVSARSFSISCGEVIDPTIDYQEEGCSESHCGVPPFELERKLHELLETRQQQQITNLEAALERARQELVEKEKEISWWKDTAHLMSRNAHHRQHTHHLLR